MSFKHVFLIRSPEFAWYLPVRRLVAAWSFNPLPASLSCVYFRSSSAATEYQLVTIQSVSVKSLFNARFHLAVQECGTARLDNMSLNTPVKGHLEKRQYVHTCLRDKISLLTEDYIGTHPLLHIIQYMLKVANNELWLLLIWHCALFIVSIINQS